MADDIARLLTESAPGAWDKNRRVGERFIEQRMISAPAAVPAPKWLDQPDRDGIWVRAYRGEYMEAGRVVGGLLHLTTPVVNYTGSQWLYLAPVPVPPPQLPKSRDVKLTARVYRHGVSKWTVDLLVGGEVIQDNYGTQSECIDYARVFGVEPEVENG